MRTGNVNWNYSKLLFACRRRKFKNLIREFKHYELKFISVEVKWTSKEDKYRMDYSFAVFKNTNKKFESWKIFYLYC